MSLNFIIKDAAHHSEQTKTYIKSVAATVALSSLFINIVQSLGIFQKPDEITQFNDTILDLFTQYNSLLVILTSLLTIVFVINSNHALVQHRKKDMTIMRAVGTVPRKLYSFYLSQLLILAIVGSIIGWFIGFGSFTLFFVIAESRIAALEWNPNIFFTLLLLTVIILLTYVINGWEIRRIGMKTYSETTSGKIKENLSAKIGGKFGSWLKKRDLTISLAIKNLIRKKYELRQNLVLISFAGMIMLTSILGVFVVNTSSRTYIENAQGENTVVIGYQDIVDSVYTGYASFTDPNVTPLTGEGYINLEYNLSNFKEDLFVLCEDYNISASQMEERIYTQMNITEKIGWKFVDYEDGGGSNLTSVGVGGRESQVILQGISFNSSLTDWTTYGSYKNETSGAFIGDTVAAQIFEVAYLQSFELDIEETNLTESFKIHAVVIDSFANGNTAYIPLELMRSILNRTEYTNLLMVEFSELDLDQQNAFLEDLNELVQSELGSEFGIKNLTLLFEQNVNSVNTITIISLILGLLMVIVIIYSLNQYQKGRIAEDTHDLSIMKMLGLEKKDNLKLLFYEQVGTIIIGISIALVLSMAFIIFILLDQASLPSIFLPIGSYIITLVILTAFSFINSKILSNRIKIRLETNFG